MKKVNDVRNLSDEEREAAYAAVSKEIKAIERSHGEAVVRWAMNRLTNERRSRRALERERKELEAKLAALDA